METVTDSLPNASCRPMYIWGFRTRQHLRSLAPVMNDYGWLWWPDDIRGPWGLKIPDICLTGEGKHRKNSPKKLVPTGDRTRVRYVTGANATTCPTEVDPMLHAHARTTYCMCKAGPRRSIFLHNIWGCAMILDVCRYIWKIVQCYWRY